jgi:hypothetical protein
VYTLCDFLKIIGILLRLGAKLFLESQTAAQKCAICANARNRYYIRAPESRESPRALENLFFSLDASLYFSTLALPTKSTFLLFCALIDINSIATAALKTDICIALISSFSMEKIDSFAMSQIRKKKLRQFWSKKLLE